MTEIIFILVTLYFVYVVRTIISDKKEGNAIGSTTKTQVSAAELINTPPVHKKVATKKPIAKKTKAKKVTPSLADGNIRNPATGEIVKVASNYRMTKRWIKEALVSEGLLDKIYKTSELTDSAKTKISKALLKLETIEKYQ